MRSLSRSFLVALAAAAALVGGVSTASANRLAFNETEFRIAWSRLSISGGGSTITCELTLSGAFHSRTVTKTAGLLVGSILAARVATCDGDGAMTVLFNMVPWHLTYNSFTGRLPSITGIRVELVGALFQVSDGITCLFGTTASEPSGGTIQISGGSVTGFRANETLTIDLQGGFLCEIAGDATLAGTATFTRAAGGTVTVSLV